MPCSPVRSRLLRERTSSPSQGVLEEERDGAELSIRRSDLVHNQGQGLRIIIRHILDYDGVS